MDKVNLFLLMVFFLASNKATIPTAGLIAKLVATLSKGSNNEPCQVNESSISLLHLEN